MLKMGMLNLVQHYIERKKEWKQYWKDYDKINGRYRNLTDKYKNIKVYSLEALIDIVNTDEEFTDFVKPLISSPKQHIIKHLEHCICSPFSFEDLFFPERRRAMDKNQILCYDALHKIYVYDEETINEKIKNEEYKWGQEEESDTKKWYEWYDKIVSNHKISVSSKNVRKYAPDLTLEKLREGVSRFLLRAVFSAYPKMPEK